jgi:multiple sugar transport system substrate-binding protein
MIDLFVTRLGPVLAGAVALMTVGATSTRAEVTLDVLYTTPGTFNALHQELARRFTDAHPDIKVKFRNPVASYEEAAQQILRDQITGRLPDVAFNGINQIGLFVDRGLGAPLDEFAAADGGLAELGYYPTLAELGRYKGKLYGLPFATSTPVLYVNADLLAKAGVDVSALPRAWPELLALGKTIEAKAGTPVTGFYYQWEQTGNWLFQSLVTSKGGRMLKAGGCSIAFDDANGMWALKTLEAFGKSGMPNLGLGQARQSFVAGNIAISADSTSYVAAAERQIGGRFQFKTIAFPARRSRRTPSRGRKRRHGFRKGRRTPEGRLEICKVRHRAGRPDRDGQFHRLYARQRDRREDAGPARRFLCKEPQPPDQYSAVAVADGMGVLSR